MQRSFRLFGFFGFLVTDFFITIITLFPILDYYGIFAWVHGHGGASNFFSVEGNLDFFGGVIGKGNPFRFWYFWDISD